MKALAFLRIRLIPSARIQCVENTFLPDRNGERYTIRHAHGDVADIAGICGTDRFGQITVPTADELITWLDRDTVTWPIGGAKPRPRLDGTVHTVTYRFLNKDAEPFPTRPSLVR